jgi:CheY-like chemotaxis protein
MKKKILAVDDNEQVLKTISFILKDEGYEVSFAKNGREFVEMVQNGFQGLVLLDVMMPVLNGWDAIGELVRLKLNPNVVICMMTVVSEPNEEGARHSSYVTGYIPKPFTDQTLIQTVNEYYGLFFGDEERNQE